jgi:hypothetical protein
LLGADASSLSSIAVGKRLHAHTSSTNTNTYCKVRTTHLYLVLVVPIFTSVSFCCTIRVLLECYDNVSFTVSMLWVARIIRMIAIINLFTHGHSPGNGMTRVWMLTILLLNDLLVCSTMLLLSRSIIHSVSLGVVLRTHVQLLSYFLPMAHLFTPPSLESLPWNTYHQPLATIGTEQDRDEENSTSEALLILRTYICSNTSSLSKVRETV